MKMKMFIITSILTIFFVNNSYSEFLKNNYRLSDSLALVDSIDGINGKVEIWLDKNCRMDIKNYNFIEDSIQQNEATLCILDNKNKVVSILPLVNVSAAWLEHDIILKKYPFWKPITIGNYAGFGSYSGNETSFFRIVNGHVKWLNAQSQKDKIVLIRSLKSNWKISEIDKNSLLNVYCTADFKDENQDLDNNFKTTFIRYRFENDVLIYYKQIKSLFWENEDDFPNENMFPNK
jgi:hypothetical protein